MRVAAYQSPLLPNGSMDAVELIRLQIAQCEAAGVEILCCPEAVLGGLADYAIDPRIAAIDVASGALERLLAPLASHSVTSIIGFTEIANAGALYNSAAILHNGAVLDVYRKVHPAVRKSVYSAGHATPVFRINDLTFGILICNDSNFPDLARNMAAQGATFLFIPTCNSLPPDRQNLVKEARAADISLATSNRATIVRADVAGSNEKLVSFGTSCVVDCNGTVLQSAQHFTEELLIADIAT